MRIPISVSDRISIPQSAIEMKVARSSGPGGQNVNKVATKVQLWIDLDQILGLTQEESERLKVGLAARLDDQGLFMVTSQMTRDQIRNIEDAEFKAAEMIRGALRRPKVRRATRPSKASKNRRFEEKKHRAQRRENRQIPRD